MRQSDALSTPDGSTTLCLFALGELRLESSAGAILSRRRKPLMLLVFLARRAPRAVSRVELASLLWGERPEAKARQSLRQALVELHHLVGDRLQVTSESVRLVTDDIALDVARFEADVAAGRDRDAIARWTGDFCPGSEEGGESAFRSWAGAESAGLQRRLAVAFERSLDAASRRGDDRESIELARRWTSLAPLDENACLHLVSALRRAGHPVDALAEHSSFVSRLRNTLDVAPSRSFLRLASTLDESARIAPPHPASHPPERYEGLQHSERLGAHRMVGREAAFLSLSSAWRVVRAGKPATVLLHAPRGMGATRLMNELVRWCVHEAPSTLVLRGSAAGVERAPFADASAILGALSEAPQIGGLAPESVAALALVVPSIAPRFPYRPAATDRSLAALASAVVEALDAVAEESPVIVIVDRADALDSASRELLAHATRGVRGGALVVLVAASADELRRQLAREAGADAIVEIGLGALAPSHIVELLTTSSALEPGDARALAEALHQESGGIPGYVVAMLDALLDDRAIPATGTHRHSTALPEIHALPMASAIERGMAERRDALGDDARAVLDAMAVHREPADVGCIADMTGLPRGAAARALDELVREGLVAARDSRRFVLAPPIVARAAYALVPPLRREALHAIAASLVPRGPVWRSRSGAHARIEYHRERANGRRVRRRSYGWRVALAALIVVALVVTVAIMRHPRTIAERDATVAIFPFSVSGGEKLDFLRAGMVDLLSTSLDGAGGLRTIDPRAVIAASRRTSDASPLTPDEAREIARRLGARFFVLGTVLGAGARLELSASLYPTGDPSAPATRASASGQSDDLFDIVDRVTAQIAIAHGAPARARLSQLAAMTTTSIDALKAYLEAQSAYRANDLYAAIPAYQRAVAADSTFALAWYGLASAASWMLQPRLEQQAAAQAVRHSERLSERDRTLLAGFAAYSRGAADSAERMASGLAESYDDIEAWALLGEVLYHHNWKRGRSATESRRAWERVLALDPRYWPALEHLAEVAALEGNTREADSLLAQYERSVGADHMMLASRALRAYVFHDERSRSTVATQLAADRGFWLILSVWYVSVFGKDIEDAQRLARLLVVPLRPPAQQGFGRVLLAHLALARGHWREARAELAIARAHAPADALEHQVLLALSPVLSTPAAELAATSAALDSLPMDEASSASSAVPWPQTPPRLQPMLRVYVDGMASARTGDAPGRQRALAQLTAMDTSGSGTLRFGLVQSIRAEQERVSGHPAAALAMLEQGARATPFVSAWTSSIVAQSYERYVRAELLHTLGRDDEALRWYGTFGENSPYDLVYLAPSLLRQAQIHDARGERSLAARRYAQFVELWRDCDPEMRALVVGARARLVELGKR